MRAAGLLFFAFAGYARIATLGEEVVDPARTIPRAIPVALALTLLVYAVVLVSALAAAGSAVLAASPAPLADAIRAGRFASVAIVARIAAAVASLGVLLSLIVGAGAWFSSSRCWTWARPSGSARSPCSPTTPSPTRRR